MMDKATPSIHEAFNARTISINTLCRSFIINDYFPRLAGKNHSVMVGARGSGKTTLMKMLQVEALDAWNANEADIYREKIDYSGIFIPTDRLWKKQYETLRKRMNNDVTTTKTLNAIFLYHVLERLISVTEYRTNRTCRNNRRFRAATISKDDEVSLVEELSILWGLSPKISTLKGLEVSLITKKVMLSGDAFNGKLGKDSFGVPDNFSIERLVPILEHAVSTINIYINEKGSKWCFLFDELELAPDIVVQPLIDATRGGPQDIIFKLSLSPYHGNIKTLGDPDSPSPRQDYSLINLSATTKKKGYDFAKKLCHQIFDKHGYSEPVESYFDKPRRRSNKDIFNELAEKDLGFSKYLKERGIHIENLDSYTEKNGSTIIRKIQFVAQLRNEYLKKDAKKRGIRRAPNYYAGFDRLCQAMEYNPRMLIGMTNVLLEDVNPAEHKISVAKQIDILEQTFRSYAALLNTIPIKVPGFNTVYELVDRLAEHASEYVKGNKFYPEPYGAFKVQKEVNENLKEAIGYALNAGALVIEDTDDRSHEDTGKLTRTVRLSYIFSHQYGLLLSFPRRIDLDSALTKRHRGQIDLL